MNLLDPNALKGFPDVSFDTTNIPEYITSITPKLLGFPMAAEINYALLKFKKENALCRSSTTLCEQ